MTICPAPPPRDFIWVGNPTVNEAFEAILRDVAKRHYGMTARKLLAKDARRDVAHARQEVMYLAWQSGRWSWPKIAQLLGEAVQDHTTVMHGARAHAKRHNLPLRSGRTTWVGQS